MTPRFKVALVVFGALVLATGALYVVLGTSKPSRGGKSSATAGRRAVGADGQPIAHVESHGLEGTADEATDGTTGTSGPGVPTGLRVPEGEDLSDPRVVKQLLAEALARTPVEWDVVVDLVRVLKEPLDLDMKRRFLDELRAGHRHGVLAAIEVLQDGSFATDLLQVLDDRELPRDVREVIVAALERLPSGDSDEIVRNLESRMTGELRNDTLILRAIAQRGGKEAARALVQYLQQSKDPRRIQTYVLQKLDLGNDPEAAQFVASALTADQPTDTLRALLDLAAKPGAKEMVDPLIALNRDGVPDDVRHEAVASLARVGTDKAVDYLLTLAEQPGAYGELAVQQIGNLQDASRASLDRLVELAGRAAQMPRPEETREQVLLALGTMRHVPGIPLMGESLKDSSIKIRVSAVRGLGRVGIPARGFVPELVDLYATGDDTMRRSVVIALGSIGGDKAHGALQQMQADTNLSPGLARTVASALTAVESASAESQEPAGPAGPGLDGSRR